MAEQAAKEPTMEEILSSIRRIISEGGEPGEEAVETAETASLVEAENTVSLGEEAVDEEAFDVSKLLEQNETPAAENENDHLLSVDELLGNDDLDYSQADDEPEVELPLEESTSEEVEAPQAELDEAFLDSAGDLDDLLGEIDAMDAEASEAMADSFEENELEPAPQMETAMAEPELKPAAVPTASPVAAAIGGNTIEGMVAGLMQPIIKEWIDANLPTIVERRVEEEINQIASKVIAALRDE